MKKMFAPAVSSLTNVLPHDGLLTPEELEDVARRIGEHPELWEPLVRDDSERRRFELIYEDDRMDAWVLSWMPGQGTGFHDHYVSSLGLACVQGSVKEDWLRFGAPELEFRLRPGDTRRGSPGYIHRVQHAVGEPAVTIHVYSPRLDEVGQYRLDEHGVIRREPAPGRTELTP
jgi:predicted metal-dependent enzyme (double-stranded beta helix superfamily)